MRNRTYGGVRGRKTKVGRKLLRFPPTRLLIRQALKTIVLLVDGSPHFLLFCSSLFCNSIYSIQLLHSFSATVGSKISPPSWWSEAFWGSQNITSLPPLRTKDEIFAFRLSMPKVADLNSLNLRQTSKLPH